MKKKPYKKYKNLPSRYEKEKNPYKNIRIYSEDMKKKPYKKYKNLQRGYEKETL